MNEIFGSLFMTLFFASALAQHDTTVCQPYKNSGKELPSLPKGYSVRTECNIITENMTIEVHEFYDASLNMSAYKQTEMDGEIYAILNYNTNQFIYIEPSEDGMAKLCQVTELSKFVPSFDKQTKESNIIRLVDALNYGKGTSLMYIKSDILRGEKVQIWKACVYDQALQATFDVSWYFSAEGWRTSSGTRAVPVRMHLVGKTVDKKGNVKRHERIYDYSEFNPKAPDYKVFELHSGSFCKGIKEKKKIPETPMCFSYGMESVSMGAGGNIRSDLYIYYDAEKKLFRMDYVEPEEGAPGYNKGPLTQIHDFNSGVAYLVYKNRGSCDMFPIDQIGEDTVSLNSGKVRMKTSKEFFGFNKKNFIYEGERNVRGIDCDVWIDTRNDWPQKNSSQSIWEWSFSSDEVLANSEANTESSFPVSLEITQPKTEINLLHNIYGVEEDFQNYDKFDISMCFDDLHRLDYQFSIHGSYKSIVRNQEEKFKSIVRMTLSIYASISPLRISNIKVDYDSEDVLVYFSLLDLPKVKGDVKQITLGNNLKDASERIVNGIASKEFKIDLGNGKLVPLKQSTFQQVNNLPSAKQGKYKPGDMAGIGLGMLLVGLLAGGLVTKYIIKKRLNDKFKSVKFDAEME